MLFRSYVAAALLYDVAVKLEDGVAKRELFALLGTERYSCASTVNPAHLVKFFHCGAESMKVASKRQSLMAKRKNMRAILKSRLDVDVLLEASSSRRPVMLNEVVQNLDNITTIVTDGTSLRVGYVANKRIVKDSDFNFCDGVVKRGGYSSRALSERTLELLLTPRGDRKSTRLNSSHRT